MTTSQETAGNRSTEQLAFAAWQRGVAGVLAKSRRITPDELPADPELLLRTRTYDDIDVAALYTARDELSESPLPGEFPFVRGGDRDRDVHRGWFVRAEFSGPAAEVNQSLRAALENGVSALTLDVDPDDVAAALDGIYLDLAPVRLASGTRTTAAADALFAELDRRAESGDGVTERSAIVIGLGADPLTSGYASRADIDLAGALALAKVAAARGETIRTILVDGTNFHNEGASDAQEIGAAVAAGVAYLRELTNTGLDATAALGQIEFQFAATVDQFNTVAKFRAARALWARVAEVVGAPEAGNAPQHAVTSAAMTTQRDPWVNMLRVTVAAFAAGTGGADSIQVLPFDAALPPGSSGTSAGFAARIARNTQLLLLEESHLGWVRDPAGGSWYVESLTNELAERAWAFLQDIERAGGFAAAHDVVTAAIATVRDRRAGDIAHRRTPITGVSEFPNLAEPPVADPSGPLDGVARYAAGFEGLRDRADKHISDGGARPAATLIALGPVAEHNARTTFAANLLASGGIACESTGPVDMSDLAVDSLGDAITGLAAGLPRTVAVVCGSDARYATAGPAAVAAARAAGFGYVVVAGTAKQFQAAAGAEVPDGYANLKIDAVAALSGLLDTFGVLDTLGAK